MRVCKFCHCGYVGWGEMIPIEGGEGFVNITYPDWTIEIDQPLIPASFAVCDCPCHWSEHGVKAYLEAIKAIWGNEV